VIDTRNLVDSLCDQSSIVLGSVSVLELNEIEDGVMELPLDIQPVQQNPQVAILQLGGPFVN
jgi:hypothetical protein